MDTGKLAIGMTAAAFAGFGIASLMRPEILKKVDVKASSSTGTAEIRAMYGGMEAGFSAFFAVALAKPEWRRPALAAIACGIGGLAAGRIAGLVMDRPRPVMYALAAAETLAAVSAVMALAAAATHSGDIVSTP